MADIHEQHLHHMAKRLHHTHMKLAGIREKGERLATRFLGTIETSTGALLGGVVEGYTANGHIGPIQYNLLIGGVLLGVGHLDLAGKENSNHLNNIGNGFIASWLGCVGSAFGQRLHEQGIKAAFGFGGAPPAPPQLPPAPPPPPVQVQGTVSPQRMNAIIDQMNQVAAQNT